MAQAGTGSDVKFSSDGDLFLCTIWWFYGQSAIAVPKVASLDVAIAAWWSRCTMEMVMG